jgi:hypothetical protein
LANPASTFPIAADDPLAAEHDLVARCVSEALAALSTKSYYEDIDLKTIASGRELLESSPERCRLLVQAAVKQAQFWSSVRDELRKTAPRDGMAMNLTRVPGWHEARGAENQAIAVMSALLRRSLPLDRADIFQLLEWMMQQGPTYGVPYGHLTRSLERYSAAHGMDAELAMTAGRFAELLRQSSDSNTKRLATAIDQMCSALRRPDEQETRGELRPAAVPSTAGDPLVLTPLKTLLAMLPAGTIPEGILCGPDEYAMLSHSPLASAHAQLTSFLEEKLQSPIRNAEMHDLASGQAILALDPPDRSKVMLAAMERNMASLLGPSADYSDPPLWKSRYALTGIVSRLSREPISLERPYLFDVVLYLAMRPHHTSPRGAKLSEG